MSSDQSAPETAATSPLTEQGLLAYLDVIRQLFAGTSDMMWVVHKGRFFWCNPVAVRQLGFDDASDLLGLSPAEISPAVQPNRSSSEELAQSMIDSAIKYGYHRFEWVHQTRSGEPLMCEITLNSVPVGTGVALLAIGRDISLIKEVENKLRVSEFTDTLTGLPNRAALVQHIGQQLAIHTPQLSLLCIGVNNFKRVNEEFGFRIGDKVLKALASVLTASLSGRGYLGRFDGDTFLVVLTDDDPQQARAWAEQALRRLDTLIEVDGVEVRTQSSIGISHLCPEVCTTKAILHRAEMAMFQSKRLGTQQVHSYSESLADEMAQEKQLLKEIRRAIEKQEFFLLFQPVFHLGSGMVTGAEALIRWRHPDRGVLTPDAFIAQAETSGLIVEIGQQVIEMACLQMARWLEQGLPLQQVSINISVKQIETGELVESLLMALNQYGIPPECMEIEVTETMLLQQGKTIASQLWRLRQAGVAIAIDDFGTGYSSFGRLKTLPVDRVKIDRSFICELETDERNGAIVQSIIALAHNLEMVVTAEGIETDFQYEFLRSHQCESGQGYLVSPPVAAVRFEHLVRQRWQALKGRH
ncbi:PAS domain S-box-containing protein/diguanylate cyclase (GGDEF) domain-containing protein [Ferrimonas sediminum]|uniref:PAS domain S-box-containing protein/diguanylate cyclase (GGDEF) domain-containing protein n=1 Tax=Ferrimonas sediminum TaxID=718193 RepID=A0A1G8WF46_9GAMM|nr:EAL domain-containing protein [Ferrimonas sediminum]SDJ76803.1 PAS domain S-box-containing protein/diguanylate cyclase (GGDEF) domain-containing protein [Ferrimonas sediminum]